MSKQATANQIFVRCSETNMSRRGVIGHIVSELNVSTGYASTLYNKARKATTPKSSVTISSVTDRIGNHSPTLEKITIVNRDTCRVMRIKMQKALDVIAAEYDVRIEVGNMSYTDSDINAKVKISTGSKSDEARRMFDRHAFKYGLKKSDYGREFSLNGSRYKVNGVKTRGRKYPILAERISGAKVSDNGKTFKLPADAVRTALK